MSPCHRRIGPGLVDKNQPCWIDLRDLLEEGLPLLLNLRRIPHLGVT